MDLIDRQAAIDALDSCQTYLFDTRDDDLKISKEDAQYALKQLPSAQSSVQLERTEERTETHGACLDAISRQAAKDMIKNHKSDFSTEKDYRTARACVNAVPPAEPKRGRWISADAMFGGVPFYCSECGENTLDTVMGKPRWNFCPNCGAKMEGEVTE